MRAIDPKNMIYDPQIKVMRWDNGVNSSLRLITVDYDKIGLWGGCMEKSGEDYKISFV